MAGRKTKLTPERQQRMIELLRGGNYVETACACVGICGKSFYTWLRKGAQGRQPYAQFAQAVKGAQAEAEARNIVIIQKAAPDTWQAAAWWLERKFPQRWARRERLALDISHMTDYELESRIAALERGKVPPTNGDSTDGEDEDPAVS